MQCAQVDALIFSVFTFPSSALDMSVYLPHCRMYVAPTQWASDHRSGSIFRMWSGLSNASRKTDGDLACYLSDR